MGRIEGSKVHWSHISDGTKWYNIWVCGQHVKWDRVESEIDARSSINTLITEINTTHGNVEQ